MRFLENIGIAICTAVILIVEGLLGWLTYLALDFMWSDIHGSIGALVIFIIMTGIIVVMYWAALLLGLCLIAASVEATRV